MLTLCNTIRGRIACGLGGVLIAVLALACLWGFSPQVTAGDDTPGKPAAAKAKGALPPVCPEPPLPPISADSPPPPLPPMSDSRTEKRATPAADLPPPKPISEGSSAKEPPQPKPIPDAPLPPPTATIPPPPPTATIPALSETTPTPPPISPNTGAGAGALIGAAVQQRPAQPVIEGQEIKQLVTQLSELRADRAKLDERERQTVQTIKRKFQDQKRSLEQLERDLRQLGINFDETAPPEEKAPVRQTGYER